MRIYWHDSHNDRFLYCSKRVHFRQRCSRKQSSGHCIPCCRHTATAELRGIGEGASPRIRVLRNGPRCLVERLEKIVLRGFTGTPVEVWRQVAWVGQQIGVRFRGATVVKGGHGCVSIALHIFPVATAAPSALCLARIIGNDSIRRGLSSDLLLPLGIVGLLWILFFVNKQSRRMRMMITIQASTGAIALQSKTSPARIEVKIVR